MCPYGISPACNPDLNILKDDIKSGEGLEFGSKGSFLPPERHFNCILDKSDI